MALSRKNPLRLLLPPSSENETVSQPQDNLASVSMDDPFAFKVPSPAARIYCSPASSNIHQPSHIENAAINYNTPNDSFINIPRPLPFSTPGPGSVLGSSVVTRTAFSAGSPQLFSSPTIYHDEESLQYEAPFTPVSHFPAAETLRFTSDLQSPVTLSGYSIDEIDHNPYLYDIYTTPGPTYCAPRPIHFDSPTEDPLFSDPPEAGFDLTFGDVDFEWHPFNRNHLVAPFLPKTPAFASASVRVDLEEDPCHKASGGKPPPATSTIQKASPPPVPPASPSPFCFQAPLPNDDASCAASAVISIVPEPQGPTKDFATPPKLPFAPVPGIYISPLMRPQTGSPPPSKNGITTAASRVCRSSSRPEFH